jgi:hypothetical protein
MMGWVKYHVWLRTSFKKEKTQIVFTIYEVYENGTETEVRTDSMKIVLTTSANAYDLMAYHSDPHTFEEGHTIKLAIYLLVKPGREYTLEYDSPNRWSYLQLPGVVVPERVIGLLFLAPILPRLMAKYHGGEGDEED